MVRLLPLALLMAAPDPAFAQAGDELAPVPTEVLERRAYFGSQAPSQIRFINVRSRPVRLFFIQPDGSERPYAVINPGQEMMQWTYVAHRWIVRDAEDSAPLYGFVSTRSALRDYGTAQIALIR